MQPDIIDTMVEAIATLNRKIIDMEVDRPTVPFVPRAATLIVAASDAATQWTGLADYSCDGTADDVEIQAALDALPAVGGRLILSEGTFHLTATVNVPSNTTVELLGTMLLNNGVNSYILRNKNYATTDVNIHIVGGTYDGNRAGQTGGLNHGIFLWNCSGSTIRDVQIVSADGKGIVVKGGSENTICRANVSDCTTDGIYVDDSDYAKINTCHVRDNSVGGSGAGNGILVVESDYVSVVSCTADGTHRNGIMLGVSCRYSHIANCIANGSDPWGNFVLYRTEHCAIVGCVSVGGANNGICVERTEGSRVEVNTVIGATKYGIHVYAGNTYATHNTQIVGNTVLDTGTTFGRGIEIGGSTTGYLGDVFDTLIATNRVDNSFNYELRIHANCTRTFIITNHLDLGVGSAHAAFVSNAGINTTIRHNTGYITENSGTDSIASGSTSKVVAHGLAITPTVINICPREQGTNDWGYYWVDKIGAANFTVNVLADPGVSNLDFAWEAKYR